MVDTSGAGGGSGSKPIIAYGVGGGGGYIRKTLLHLSLGPITIRITRAGKPRRG